MTGSFSMSRLREVHRGGIERPCPLGLKGRATVAVTAGEVAAGDQSCSSDVAAVREPPGGTVPGGIRGLAAMTGHLRLASQPKRTVPTLRKRLCRTVPLLTLTRARYTCALGLSPASLLPPVVATDIPVV